MVQFGVKKSSNVEPAKGFVYGDSWNKDHAKKGFCVRKFEEFCRRTDLHGYKYIVMEEYNLLERFGWALAVILSIAFAAYFVVTAYRWYAKNPIVTVIESTQGAIWDVPFPAITVCDLNIVSRNAARKLADNMTLPNNVTSDFIFETFRLVPLLYSTFVADPKEKEHLTTLQTVLDFNNISIEMLVQQLSPAAKCSNLVQRCMWKNAIYRCEDIFKPIYTLLSLCCAFNYYAIKDNGTKKYDDTIVTAHPGSPRRVASCGYQTALTALLYTNITDYYSATAASQGALVIIDNAYNIPDLDSPVRMVNPSTEVLIALSPERTYTTSGIKSVSPERRQCYYSDEIYGANDANRFEGIMFVSLFLITKQAINYALNILGIQISKFRQYSFHNCLAYQKIEFLKRGCNCIPISYPKEDNFRTCNFNDIGCIENVLNEEQSGNISIKNSNILQCLPECEHYDYPLEVALGRLAENAYVNGLPFFLDVNLKNRSLLNVFFNDLVSTRYRRDIYLNWQNILAAFGGLLSLMLGFTVISGFDVIIFFIVHVVCEYISDTICQKIASNKIHVKEYHKNNTWKGRPFGPKEKSVDKTKSGSYENQKY